MRRWQRARQGLCLVVLILVSCSAPGSNNPQEGCGGVEASVSCLQINSIVPIANGVNTSNVDAHQDICIDPATGNVTAVETFTDHNAQITLTNKKFPTASNSFDIRLIGYSVSYSINQCPMRARGCPPLPGFTVASQTTIIPANSSVTLTLPFVPLRVKDAYAAAGGELFSAFLPSYDVTYVFTAQTVNFNQTFTVSGDAEFTIGDFLTGGFTCQGIFR